MPLTLASNSPMPSHVKIKRGKEVGRYIRIPALPSKTQCFERERVITSHFHGSVGCSHSGTRMLPVGSLLRSGQEQKRRKHTVQRQYHFRLHYIGGSKSHGPDLMQRDWRSSSVCGQAEEKMDWAACT